jgi:hypothetical protein
MYKQIKVWPYGFEVKLKVEPKGHVMKNLKENKNKIIPIT